MSPAPLAIMLQHSRQYCLAIRFLDGDDFLR